jgi:hypothetical protein
MVTNNPPNTPKVTNVAISVNTSDGVDEKTDNSSNGASFTLVSHGRKSRASTPKTHFTEVTKTKFPAFQQVIFPIVENILKENVAINSTFAKQWRALQANDKIAPNNSYRTLQKMLKVNHLPEYRKMLETLPGLQDYIVFREDRLNHALIERTQDQSVAMVLTSTTSRQQDGSKDEAEKETILIKEEDFNGDDDTIATTPHAKKVCYRTDADIKEMFSDMWPYIQDYIDRNSTTMHAKQWLAWMERGLLSKSPLTQVKAIMGIDTVAQIYLILRDFPVIHENYEV